MLVQKLCRTMYRFVIAYLFHLIVKFIVRFNIFVFLTVLVVLTEDLMRD